MNDDVLPELLEEVQTNFEQEFGKSEVVVKALKTLEAKKATYANANDFAIEVGEILSKALTTSVTAESIAFAYVAFLASRVFKALTTTSLLPNSCSKLV